MSEVIAKIMQRFLIAIHKLMNLKLYKNKVILHGVPHLVHRDKIRIGADTRINPDVVLYGHGGIEIGENVTLSHGAAIFSTGYETSNWQLNKKIKEHKNEKVQIDDNAWVGANAIILPGAYIPEGSIIAAGSTVTKKLEQSNSLYAGNPAKFIKKL